MDANKLSMTCNISLLRLSSVFSFIPPLVTLAKHKSRKMVLNGAPAEIKVLIEVSWVTGEYDASRSITVRMTACHFNFDTHFVGFPMMS